MFILVSYKSSIKHCYYHRRDEYTGNEVFTDNTYKAFQVIRKLQMEIITQLLRVKAVLPVKSNEAERLFGYLKLIKTYIQNLMTNKR